MKIWLRRACQCTATTLPAVPMRRTNCSLQASHTNHRLNIHMFAYHDCTDSQEEQLLLLLLLLDTFINKANLRQKGTALNTCLSLHLQMLTSKAWRHV